MSSVVRASLVLRRSPPPPEHRGARAERIRRVVLIAAGTADFLVEQAHGSAPNEERRRESNHGNDREGQDRAEAMSSAFSICLWCQKARAATDGTGRFRCSSLVPCAMLGG